MNAHAQANAFAAETHWCYFNEKGVTEEICQDISNDPARNRSGCARTNCSSRWRVPLAQAGMAASALPTASSRDAQDERLRARERAEAAAQAEVLRKQRQKEAEERTAAMAAKAEAARRLKETEKAARQLAAAIEAEAMRKKLELEEAQATAEALRRQKEADELERQLTAALEAEALRERQEAEAAGREAQKAERKRQQSEAIALRIAQRQEAEERAEAAAIDMEEAQGTMREREVIRMREAAAEALRHEERKRVEDADRAQAEAATRQAQDFTSFSQNLEIAFSAALPPLEVSVKGGFDGRVQRLTAIIAQKEIIFPAQREEPTTEREKLVLQLRAIADLLRSTQGYVTVSGICKVAEAVMPRNAFSNVTPYFFSKKLSPEERQRIGIS